MIHSEARHYRFFDEEFEDTVLLLLRLHTDYVDDLNGLTGKKCREMIRFAVDLARMDFGLLDRKILREWIRVLDEVGTKENPKAIPQRKHEDKEYDAWLEGGPVERPVEVVEPVSPSVLTHNPTGGPGEHWKRETRGEASI